MSLFAEINWYAVGAAALLNMGIGAVWYSKPIFGTVRKRLEGSPRKRRAPESAEAAKGRFWACVLSFAAALGGSAVLSVFIRAASPFSVWGGIGVALLAWFGFVAAELVAEHVFSADRRPAALSLLFAGYYLVSFAACGMLLAWWA